MFIQETKWPFQQTDKSSSVTTETDRGEGESFFCQRTTASICLPVCLSTHLSGHLPRRGVSLEQSLNLVALHPFKDTLAIRPFLLFVSSLWRRGGETWILNMLHQSGVGGVGVTTLSSLQHDANVTESVVKVRSGGVLRTAWRHFKVLGKLMTAEFCDHNLTINYFKYNYTWVWEVFGGQNYTSRTIQRP